MHRNKAKNTIAVLIKSIKTLYLFKCSVNSLTSLYINTETIEKEAGIQIGFLACSYICLFKYLLII